MPQEPTADTAGASKDSVNFDGFTGLRNTVAPERMGPKELTRAVNVDIDDEEELRRRRGYRKVLLGQFHSLFAISNRMAVVVKDGMLGIVQQGYKFRPLLAGIAPEPLSYIHMGEWLFVSSAYNSCKVHLGTMQVKPWGLIYDRNYQPGLDPAPSDWWYSPVSDPELDAGLGPIEGQLLGPPPPSAHIAYYNGRIYLADGPLLWATELYRYDWIDRNAGFRQYESCITGLCAVEDGIYVGTQDGLYFVAGMWGEEKRTLKEEAGVVEGTMIRVPGELVNPDGKRRPDIPQHSVPAMSCMTTAGQCVGMPGGEVFNLTRTRFDFPNALRGTSFFRHMDGLSSIITSLDSGGTPSDNARIGDYCDATITRAADRRGA